MQVRALPQERKERDHRKVPTLRALCLVRDRGHQRRFKMPSLQWTDRELQNRVLLRNGTPPNKRDLFIVALYSLYI